MKVFAGDNFHPPADATYKNLVWEILPVPDILFHMHTPAIVSLEMETCFPKVFLIACHKNLFGLGGSERAFFEVQGECSWCGWMS